MSKSRMRWDRVGQSAKIASQGYDSIVNAHANLAERRRVSDDNRARRVVAREQFAAVCTVTRAFLDAAGPDDRFTTMELAACVAEIAGCDARLCADVLLSAAKVKAHELQGYYSKGAARVAASGYMKGKTIRPNIWHRKGASRDALAGNR